MVDVGMGGHEELDAVDAVALQVGDHRRPRGGLPAVHEEVFAPEAHPGGVPLADVDKVGLQHVGGVPAQGHVGPQDQRPQGEGDQERPAQAATMHAILHDRRGWTSVPRGALLRA